LIGSAGGAAGTVGGPGLDKRGVGEGGTNFLLVDAGGPEGGGGGGAGGGGGGVVEEGVGG
ncbi:hypothetical protein AK79_24240, partial [Salmonella enterica subsp. enterica serovar Bareilly str. CFSAN001089]